MAPAARRLNRGPCIVRSWDRLAPWWPWSVGPGAWAVGPAAGTVGRGAWTWCRWPPGRAAGAGGHLVAQLVPVAVFVFVCRPVPCLYVQARTYKHPGPPPTRGPKNGPGASCAGSSPFLHGQWCIKQFLRSSNKGPPLSTKSTRVKIFKNLKRNGLP